MKIFLYSSNNKKHTQTEEMSIVYKEEGNTVILDLEGNLDAAHVPQMEAFFRNVFEKKPKHVILNGAHLEFVSEGGLRALLNFSKQMQTISGKISFAHPSLLIRQIFGISGLSACIPFYETVEAAQKADLKTSSEKTPS